MVWGEESFMYVMLQQLQVHTREVMGAQLAVQNMTMSMYVYEVFPPDNFPRVVYEIL